MKTLSCILAFLLTGLLPLASGQDAEFISQVAAAQREATADYPDLARVGTPLNKRFVSEYTRLKKADDPILSGPDWPKKLARRCAEDLGIQPATTGRHRPHALDHGRPGKCDPSHRGRIEGDDLRPRHAEGPGGIAGQLRGGCG